METANQWLKKLIAFDTTSKYSNLALIEELETWLTSQGLILRITHDPNEKKANLFATLPAQNGTVDNGIILSGHTDVVPVDGQKWDTDPFIATEKDGKVFGRGACDMKGFIAVVLSLVPELKARKLTYPIHLAFSYDEETGCRGAPIMIDDVLKANYKPRACIVGEPSNMQPIIGHKGIQVFRCTVHGHAAHSSLTPQGCNAIEYAAELICYIRQLANQLRKEGPVDEAYDVPFTSISTNLIQGGIAQNIIPELCEFYFEFRHLADVKPSTITNKINHFIEKELFPKMKVEAGQPKIELSTLAAVPSFAGEKTADIYSTAARLLNSDVLRKVAYATEAGFFQEAAIPTIVCGPGSIEQAHRANEFVTIEQLNRCEAFLRELLI